MRRSPSHSGACASAGTGALRPVAAMAMLFVLAGNGFGGDVRQVALLHEPDGDATAAGVIAPFGRLLDGTDLVYAPASLPEPAEAAIAAAAADLSGEAGAEALDFLRRESDEFGLDAVLLLRVQEVGKDVVPVLVGAAAPFDEWWAVRAEGAPAESLARPLGILADSAAVRLGGSPAAERRFFPVHPEAEAALLSARRYGSLVLASKAAEGGPPEALSDLGFRLVLRGSRARGAALVDSVRGGALGPFDRLVHRARLAHIGGTEEEREDAVHRLRRDFPDRFETMLFEGLLHESRGEWGRARRRYGEAIRRRPLDPLPHRLLARAALRDGYLDVAHEEFGRALGLVPEDVLARIGLASVLYSQGLLDEAGRALGTPPPPDPHGVEGARPRFLLLAARAGLSHSQGRFGEALADLRRARDEAHRLRDEESLVDLTIRIFYVLLDARRIDEAWAELSEIRYRLSRNDGGLGFPPGLLPYLEGLHAAYRQDRAAVAAKRLEIETSAGADRAMAELIDGYYFLLHGSGWDATPAFRRALGGERDRLVRHLLGRAATSSGRYGVGIQDLEWVVERGESLLDLPPVLPLSFYYLGRALDERGDADRARLAYREFFHYWKYADPGRPESEEARRRLFPGSGGPDEP